jgi:hypothetical protein
MSHWRQMALFLEGHCSYPHCVEVGYGELAPSQRGHGLPHFGEIMARNRIVSLLQAARNGGRSLDLR